MFCTRSYFSCFTALSPMFPVLCIHFNDVLTVVFPHLFNLNVLLCIMLLFLIRSLIYLLVFPCLFSLVPVHPDVPLVFLRLCLSRILFCVRPVLVYLSIEIFFYCKLFTSLFYITAAIRCFFLYTKDREGTLFRSSDYVYIWKLLFGWASLS